MEVPTIFLNKVVDSSKLELPVLKPKYVTFLSRFYKNNQSESLQMELVYLLGKWIPTWKLTRERIGSLIARDFVNVCFTITVKEGTVLKRVTKEGRKTTTNLYLVTRFGLIELLYDYERGVYIIKDSFLKIPDEKLC